MSIYFEKGFADREDYLLNLSLTWNLPYNFIESIANILGAEEDFTKLVEILKTVSVLDSNCITTINEDFADLFSSNVDIYDIDEEDLFDDLDEED